MNAVKKNIILLLFLFIPVYSYADDISLNDIKKEIARFLTEVEGHTESAAESIDNSMLLEHKTQLPIKQGMKGVFLFNIPSFHEYLHFLLVDDTGFQIINMHDPFEKSLIKLIVFFEHNKYYDRDDIILYLNEFIRVYDLNIKQNVHIIK